MEGLSLPRSIGFKWPRMALPCQCLVFNALSELVLVAKLLTETRQITASRSSTFKYSKAALRWETRTRTHTRESHEPPRQLTTAPAH